MNSISDSESPQSKTYVAGFVARAIAKVQTCIQQLHGSYQYKNLHVLTLVECNVEQILRKELVSDSHP